MRYILWFWRTKESWPPSLFAFITLITYQFSLLPFACLACLCASLCSRTLVSPLTLPGVLTYQHTWFCLFAIFTLVYCQVAPIIFYPFYQSFFHFLIFSSPLTLPDLLQPAFFTCLFCLFVLPLFSLRPYGWVGLTRRVCGFAHHFPRQHRTQTQRASKFEPLHPLLRLAQVAKGRLSFSPFTFPSPPLWPW